MLENDRMLNASINAIKLCGQRMLPLSGHREVKVEGDIHNKGVFRAILNTIALYNNTIVANDLSYCSKFFLF